MSGCGGSSSKQMCFCHYPSSDKSFNHWIFIRNPDFSGNKPLDFFLFKGNENDCHKACDDAFMSINDLPERHVTDSKPYLGVESKLVSVNNDDLMTFAEAAGFAPISQMIASGNPVSVNKSLNSMYHNLQVVYSDEDSKLLSLLNTKKFSFLAHNYQYCSAGEVCSASNAGSIASFNINYNTGNSLVFNPKSYECVSPNLTTVVVNDIFCWATGDSKDYPTYYSLCSNFTKKSEKQGLPPYGCLCSKDQTTAPSDDNVITRFNTLCCNNGEVSTCS